MLDYLDISPKGLNLTSIEKDELIRGVVNFLGHRRRDKFAFPLLITLYSFIFATGLTGNLCKFDFLFSCNEKNSVHLCFLIIGTCFIIWKSRDMHTPTNFYLFSLAVSDLLLINLGKSKTKLTIVRVLLFLNRSIFILLILFTKKKQKKK